MLYPGVEFIINNSVGNPMVLLLLLTFHFRENLNHKMTRTKAVITSAGHRVTVPRRGIGVGLTKRRYRPGTVALREIRRHQTSTNLLIPKVTFQRLVKEIVYNECRDRHLDHFKKIQSTALLTLQTVFEDYCVQLFSISQIAAIHGNRITVKPEDIQLVRLFRGDNINVNKPTNP